MRNMKIPVAGTGTRRHLFFWRSFVVRLYRNSRLAHRPGNQSRVQYVHRFPLIFVGCSSRVTVPSPTRNRPVCRALPLHARVLRGRVVRLHSRTLYILPISSVVFCCDFMSLLALVMLSYYVIVGCILT